MGLISIMAQENLFIIEGEKGHQFPIILKEEITTSPPQNQTFQVQDQDAEALLPQREFCDFYYLEST